MDDKLKQMSFKDFITVDNTMSGDDYLAYQSQKRRRGTIGEETNLSEKRIAGLMKVAKDRTLKSLNRNTREESKGS